MFSNYWLVEVDYWDFLSFSKNNKVSYYTFTYPDVRNLYAFSFSSRSNVSIKQYFTSILRRTHIIKNLIISSAALVHGGEINKPKKIEYKRLLTISASFSLTNLTMSPLLPIRLWKMNKEMDKNRLETVRKATAYC